jgi:hypothetical protein
MKAPLLEAALKEALSPARADGLDCSPALYRYAAGDMSPEEAADFRAHLVHCKPCRADLEVFHRTEESARRRWYPLSAWFRRWRLGLAASTLVAGLVFSVWFLRQDGDRTDPIATLRAKGSPALHVAVRRGEQSFRASDATQFLDGDVLSFFYTAAKGTWPVVLFADRNGELSRVYPAGAPVLLPEGVEQPIPASAVVQHAAGCEWLVAFFSPKERPPQVGELEAALRSALAARKPDAACTLPQILPRGVSATTIVVVNRGS